MSFAIFEATKGGICMRWATPKNAKRVTWELSKHSLDIVEYYAKYAGRPQNEIVDQFLQNILGDPRFARYLRTQRRNKRLVSKLFFGDTNMSLLDEYARICGTAGPVYELTEPDTETTTGNSAVESA